IDCIDLVYPLTFFIYNSNQQQTGTQTVGNDGELLALLLSLDPGTYIALQFPINVVLQNGTIVEVNNNSELVTLISDCSSNGGGFPSNFETILTSGSWFVTYFFDDVDETQDFAGYEFTFATDNTAQAVGTSNTVDGTWSLTNSNTPDLNLFFGTNDPFDELDEDWDIIEAAQDIIKLKHISGGDGSVDFLTYERTPNGGGGGNTTELTNILLDGQWFVQSYIDDGDNETNDYNGYNLTFNSDGTVVAENGSITINGTWSVVNSSNGLDVILDFGAAMPFNEFNDDWDVVAYTTTKVELFDISGGNGGTDYLTFQKL